MYLQIQIYNKTYTRTYVGVSGACACHLEITNKNNYRIFKLNGWTTAVAVDSGDGGGDKRRPKNKKEKRNEMEWNEYKQNTMYIHTDTHSTINKVLLTVSCLSIFLFCIWVWTNGCSHETCSHSSFSPSCSSSSYYYYYSDVEFEDMFFVL